MLEIAQESARVRYVGDFNRKTVGRIHRFGYVVLRTSPPEEELGAENGPAKIQVYDSKSGKIQEQELPDSTTGSWTLSSDGKSVAFTDAGYVDVYPFTDGRLDVANRKRLGAADPHRVTPEIVAGQNPSQFFVYDFQLRTVARYDAATGEHADIPIKAINELKQLSGKLGGWGRVPGTNDLWFAEEVSGHYSLHRYGIDPNGRSVRRAPPRGLDTGRYSETLLRRTGGTVARRPARPRNPRWRHPLHHAVLGQRKTPGRDGLVG